MTGFRGWRRRSCSHPKSAPCDTASSIATGTSQENSGDGAHARGTAREARRRAPARPAWRLIATSCVKRAAARGRMYALTSVRPKAAPLWQLFVQLVEVEAASAHIFAASSPIASTSQRRTQLKPAASLRGSTSFAAIRIKAAQARSAGLAPARHDRAGQAGRCPRPTTRLGVAETFEMPPLILFAFCHQSLKRCQAARAPMKLRRSAST